MRAGEEARHLCFSPALLAAVVTALLALPGCKVVYDEPPAKDGAPAATAPGGFDAAASVDGLWSGKVVPFLSAKAIDVAELLPAVAADPEEAGKKYGHRADAEGSPWSFAVKGRGRVVSVSTASRAGTMVVAVKAGGAAREVTLQIGPVVRGSALRDCLPFFSFGDVKNQIEFAQVGRAMNDRALKAVQDQVKALATPGTEVAFTGATSLTGGEMLLITPASLAPASGAAP